MSDMKCPFCNLDIRSHRIYLDGCDNTRSPLWQEFIKLREENERTRKALDIATNAIESAKDHNIVNCIARGVSLSIDDVHITLFKALEQITASE